MSPANVPTRTSATMPPPCGRSRRSTAWASGEADPRHARARRPRPPGPVARGVGDRDEEQDGEERGERRARPGPASPSCGGDDERRSRRGTRRASAGRGVVGAEQLVHADRGRAARRPRRTTRRPRPRSRSRTPARARRRRSATRGPAAHQRPPNRRRRCGVLRQRGLERRAVEVRPQLVDEDQLGVRRLPHEVVAEPPLAARADDEVRVVHLGRVEQLPERLLAAARVARSAASRISARPP